MNKKYTYFFLIEVILSKQNIKHHVFSYRRAILIKH